jgi:hypothetical protein
MRENEMTSDEPEREILEKLKGPIERGEVTVSHKEDETYVALLSRRFPRYFPHEGALFVAEFDYDDPPSYESLFDRFVETIGLPADALLTVIGESSTKLAYTLSIAVLRQYLGDFLGLPQHTYIVDENADWCLCFRMERYGGFGHAIQP